MFGLTLVKEKEVDGEMLLCDHPKEVWVRYSYDVREKPQCVSFFKKRNRETLDVAPPILYPMYPIPIKKAKADDLKKLVSDYLPHAYQPCCADLPVTEGSDEDEDD